MRARRLLLGLVAALLTPPLLAAEVNRSWETLVATTRPERRVVVVQHNGKQVEGQLLSLTEGSITVQGRPQPVTIQRDDVFRVRAAGVRAKRSLIGFGIGVAVGVVFGANLGSRRHGLSAVVFGGVFGGIGTAGGAAIPVGNPLYEGPGGLKKSGP